MRRAAEALSGRVAKVVLYGSRARGEGAADSDWDLAVFLHRNKGTYCGMIRSLRRGPSELSKRPDTEKSSLHSVFDLVN